jgi:hypothetical protein
MIEIPKTGVGTPRPARLLCRPIASRSARQGARNRQTRRLSSQFPINGEPTAVVADCQDQQVNHSKI